MRTKLTVLHLWFCHVEHLAVRAREPNNGFQKKKNLPGVLGSLCHRYYMAILYHIQRGRLGRDRLHVRVCHCLGHSHSIVHLVDAIEDAYYESRTETSSDQRPQATQMGSESTALQTAKGCRLVKALKTTATTLKQHWRQPYRTNRNLMRYLRKRARGHGHEPKAASGGMPDVSTGRLMRGTGGGAVVLLLMGRMRRAAGRRPLMRLPLYVSFEPCAIFLIVCLGRNFGGSGGAETQPNK